MKKIAFFLSCLLVVSVPILLADEEASDDSSSSGVKGFAGGVKQIAYEGPKEFAKETVSQVPRKPPIVAVVEGVNAGTQKLLDHTVKGAYKVATLGKGDLKSYKVEEPKKGSDEPTKIKISLPGT